MAWSNSEFQATTQSLYEDIGFLSKQISLSNINDYPQSLRQSYQLSLELKYHQLQGVELNSDNPTCECISGRQSSIAVVVHFFYEEMWLDLEARLKLIPLGVGIFITCPIDKVKIASHMVHKEFPNARIISSNNIGMDIYPFLSIIPILKNEGYEIVFKFQTKKGQNLLGEIWRDTTFDMLIGEEGRNFLRISENMLNDPKIILSGPAPFYLSSSRQMMQNKEKLKLVLSDLSLSHELLESEWGFFAGTMFCIRVSALEELSNAYNLSSNNHANKYQLDGNIEHAIERIFGLLPRITGGYVGLLYPSVFGFKDSIFIKSTNCENISKAVNISTILRSIQSLDADISKILPFFDINLYSQQFSDINNSKICKVRHYLLHGILSDALPCKSLNVDGLWWNYFYQKNHKIAQKVSGNLATFASSLCENHSFFDNIYRTHNYAANIELVDYLEKFAIFSKSHYEYQLGVVFSSRTDAIKHYVSKGVSRGYSPSDIFNPTEYLSLNQDVANACLEPLYHWTKFGAIENRRHHANYEQESHQFYYLKYVTLNKSLIDWRDLQNKNWEKYKISIVIPVFNNFELTKNCIKSIYSSKSLVPFEVICVDNGSQQSVSKSLDELGKQYENFFLIKNSENLNFALGCNIGFNNSSGSVTVFLNNDTLVEDYWADKLFSYLETNSDSVAVQPRLVYEDLSIQCVGVVFADKQIIGYPIYQGIHPNDSLYSVKHERFKAITAACFAVRSVDFASVEGFDCHYINGQEDIDLCLRLSSSNDKYCSVLHDVTVVHLESKTPNRGKFIKQNRLFFAKRWRNIVEADDRFYYSKDNLCISGWVRDSDVFVKLNIASHRPKLRERRPQDPQFWWSHDADESIVKKLLDFESNTSINIPKIMVSIIMPTKNRSEIILNAINSVLNQSHQNFELLIVDDGSDDLSTKHLVDSIGDPRISLIRTPPRGVASARNTALDAATGSYISFLDSDNSWEPDFLRFSLLFLLSTGNKACYSGLKAVDDNNNTLYFRCNDYNKQALFNQNFIDLNCIFHERSVLARNDQSLKRLVDWDYILSMACQVDFSPLKLILVNYYDGTSYSRITKRVAQKNNEIKNLLEYVKNKDRSSYSLSPHNISKVPANVDLSAQVLKSNHSKYTSFSNDIPGNLRIRIKSPCPNKAEQPFWGDHHFALALVNAFKKLGVSSCYIDNLDQWYSTPATDYDVSIVLRGLSKYEPDPSHLNIIWLISHPEKVFIEELRQYNKVFCASQKYSNYLEHTHSLGVSPLLQATDTDLFCPDMLNKQEKKGLLFVGNSRRVYRKSVKYLIENYPDQLRVIGREWEQFIDTRFVEKQNVVNFELCKTYQSSTFVFNDHWDKMRDLGFISNRIFDVLASGVRLITDKVEGLDQVISPRILFSYENIEEVGEYLSNPKCWPSEGELIEASNVIRDQHSFLNRAQSILIYIKNYRFNHLL